MVSSAYGKTYDQGHNGSLRTTRQRSHRTYQRTVRMSIGYCGYSACIADDSAWRDTPTLSARNKDSLLSPWLEGQGSYAR